MAASNNANGQPSSNRSSMPMRQSTRSGDPRSEARKAKTQAAAWGQVFTPVDLAKRMVEELGLTEALPNSLVIDPCVGPATFPAAIADLCRNDIAITAYDVDPKMIAHTRKWALTQDVVLELQNADYLLSDTTKAFDYAILNPPYVRQEWIRNKNALRSHFQSLCDVTIPGASNLYVYFIVKVLAELKEEGAMACIVYDSWLATRYGRWLEDHLSSRCADLRVESTAPLPFEGRLIDATIIYATKRLHRAGQLPSHNAAVRQQKDDSSKTIDDLFKSKRGLRLKQAKFFLSSIAERQNDGSVPFIKKAQSIRGFQVPSTHSESVLLATAQHQDPLVMKALESRLEKAKCDPSRNVSILTWASERPKTWAFHSPPMAATFLFNYYLRGRPRVLINDGRLYSDNFYGLVARCERISPNAWLAFLNSTCVAAAILREARNQGAGLAKLQLFEFRRVQLPDPATFSTSLIAQLDSLGRSLRLAADCDSTIHAIDAVIGNESGRPELALDRVHQQYCEADARARRTGGPRPNVA
jgi:adenine-specific DNA-methyltransferase